MEPGKHSVLCDCALPLYADFRNLAMRAKRLKLRSSAVCTGHAALHTEAPWDDTNICL